MTAAELLHLVVGIGWRTALLLIVLIAVVGGDRPTM